jgi:glucose/arabinose dehydrogenase
MFGGKSMGYSMRRRHLHWLALLLGLVSAAALATPLAVEKTEKYTIRPRILATGLNHPWGLVFLPDGRLLVTERPGRLLLIGADGIDKKLVSGLPPIKEYGQGGLLDVALHPDFSRNQWLYLSYAGAGVGGIGTEVARARLRDDRLEDLEVLFRLQPKSDLPYHFGSRLVFDRNGYLFITLGDRGEMARAQRLDDHAGSVIRLLADGKIPEDNPFVSRSDALPEIFSYGHRNAQGAALHPLSGELWLHEHGPQGGDELNRVRAGGNYGWPVITYGVNYGSGTPIGEGSAKPGMAQPLYYWVPSIAPSGMAFYDGQPWPDWKDDLFVGSLKFQLLVRLELDGEKVVHEERMLEGLLGRIRDVRVGPDGLIYLLTDAADGKLVRLEPVQD